MSKFYYTDKEGNKQEFAGLSMYDPEIGSYVGLLTNTVRESNTYTLNFVPEVSPIEGYPAYYTYTQNNGKQAIYEGPVKLDENGDEYFTYSVINNVTLNRHEVVQQAFSYYTYISDGIEQTWTDDVKFNRMRKTYYGIKQL